MKRLTFGFILACSLSHAQLPEDSRPAATNIQGAQAMYQGLDQAGIKHVFFESKGTSHEFQTWRRSLHDFAGRLFRK